MQIVSHFFSRTAIYEVGYTLSCYLEICNKGGVVHFKHSKVCDKTMLQKTDIKKHPN